jgi:hypothetical protein
MGVATAEPDWAIRGNLYPVLPGMSAAFWVDLVNDNRTDGPTSWL